MLLIWPLVSLKFNFDPFYGVCLLQLFTIVNNCGLGGQQLFTL